MADLSSSHTDRKRSSFATKHFQRKSLKIFDLHSPLRRLVSFVERIITWKVRCWVTDTQTQRPSTVTLAAHTCRALITQEDLLQLRRSKKNFLKRQYKSLTQSLTHYKTNKNWSLSAVWEAMISPLGGSAGDLEQSDFGGRFGYVGAQLMYVQGLYTVHFVWYKQLKLLE